MSGICKKNHAVKQLIIAPRSAPLKRQIAKFFGALTGSPPARLAHAYASQIVVPIFAVLFLHNASMVWRWGVDVLHWDEWEYMSGDQMPAGFSLEWLFRQHNEHRIVPTKLMAWALYEINGLNVFTAQLINFALFVGGVVMLTRYLAHLLPNAKFWNMAAFALFLASPRLYENHLWGFQSQFHFAWIAGGLAAWLWIREELTVRRVLWGAFAAIVAALSFSGGVVAALAVTGVFAAHRTMVFARAATPEGKRREISLFLIGALPVAVVLALWFANFTHPNGHPDLVLPTDNRFWLYFANLISSGFGSDSTDGWIAGYFAVLVAAPLFGLVWRDRWRGDVATWAIIAGAGAAIAFLVSIAVGRAGFPVSSSKASRYCEIAALLVPITAAAYWLWLKDRPKAQQAALTIVWISAFSCYGTHWKYKRYRTENRDRLAGLECLGNLYFRTGAPVCPTIYPADLREKADNAARMKLSFFQKLKAENGAP